MRANSGIRSISDHFPAGIEPVTDIAACLPHDLDQGFGWYHGAIALRAANPDSLARYGGDRKVLDAYLKQWPEIRREQLHRWKGAD